MQANTNVVMFKRYNRMSTIIWLTLPQDDLALEVSGLGVSLGRLASSSSANPQLQSLHALAFLVVAHTDGLGNTKIRIITINYLFYVV